MQRQRNYLDRWGYPYVMEEFRFHMTLTGRLDSTCRWGVVDMLRARFAAGAWLTGEGLVAGKRAPSRGRLKHAHVTLL
jgi:hypothetical protein